MASHLVFAFSILGNVAAALVYLAPAPTFRKIYWEKFSEGHHPIPYVVALFSFTMWFYYGCLIKNVAVISTNALGCTIEMVYISIYMYYALQPARIFAAKILGFFTVLLLIVFAVTFSTIQGPWRTTIIEWICLISTVLAFGAPITSVYQMIRERSFEHMPVTLSFCLTLSGGVWCTYGLLKEDFLVAIPNAIGFLFGTSQIAVYLVFRNSGPLRNRCL